MCGIIAVTNPPFYFILDPTPDNTIFYSYLHCLQVTLTQEFALGTLKQLDLDAKEHTMT